MWTNGATIAAIILCFIGILIWGDPNLLRSESHTYRMKFLEILGDHKQDVKPTVASTTITNPKMPDPATVPVPEPENKTVELEKYEQ